MWTQSSISASKTASSFNRVRHVFQCFNPNKEMSGNSFAKRYDIVCLWLIWNPFKPELSSCIAEILKLRSQEHKHLTVWITTNCGKFFKRWEYQAILCLLRNLYAGQEATVRTGQGIMDGSKFGKEYIKAVYCHPAYLTYRQSTSWKIPG